MNTEHNILITVLFLNMISYLPDTRGKNYVKMA